MIENLTAGPLVKENRCHDLGHNPGNDIFVLYAIPRTHCHHLIASYTMTAGGLGSLFDPI
jgi:hypothetical protein